ncbi:MAG TPA: DUF3311 domain-containing protein [Pseudonocardiaceae bacterium]|jgi:hypothetical protein|nr:DUF3311 domain-containing protein [Pseudonocardiaceae bacterium]
MSTPESSPPARRRSSRAWYLLLLLPLLMLVTPLFNRATPRIAGLPFFYWFQFLFVLVGVGCVWIVYLVTRNAPTVTDQPDRLSVDDLDEGGRS